MSHVDQPFLEALRVRVIDGARGQHMLMTLLSDCWLHESAHVPAGALIELMTDHGIGESGTRTLLSRMTKAGRLEVSRNGRRSYYTLSDEARSRLRAGLQRVARFAAVDLVNDAAWTGVAFSIPEGRRADRQKLRNDLAWFGFVPLYDGLWIIPRPAGQQAREILRSLNVESASVFEGEVDGIGLTHGNPIDAWDLEHIRGAYEQFIQESDALSERMRSEPLSPRESLVRRTELMNVWRAFPRLDPSLPLAHLPTNWPRALAQGRFTTLYDGLAAAALHRVREVVDRHDPGVAHFVTGHVMATGLAAYPG